MPVVHLQHFQGTAAHGSMTTKVVTKLQKLPKSDIGTCCCPQRNVALPQQKHIVKLRRACQQGLKGATVGSGRYANLSSVTWRYHRIRGVRMRSRVSSKHRCQRMVAHSNPFGTRSIRSGVFRAAIALFTKQNFIHHQCYAHAWP